MTKEHKIKIFRYDKESGKYKVIMRDTGTIDSITTDNSARFTHIFIE